MRSISSEYTIFIALTQLACLCFFLCRSGSWGTTVHVGTPLHVVGAAQMAYVGGRGMPYAIGQSLTHFLFSFGLRILLGKGFTLGRGFKNHPPFFVGAFEVLHFRIFDGCATLLTPEKSMAESRASFRI